MSQINGLSLDRAVAGASPNRFSEMESEDFLRIIFAELTNQDPLQPNDTGALLDQLNSIRSIEADLQLMQQLEVLVTENQLASAGSMLGRVVEGRTEAFGRVIGTVVSVSREGDRIGLRLDNGTTVPFENVETIFDASLLEDGDSSVEGSG